MLNLANILFGSGKPEEAIRAADLGIKYSINNTAATIYFTIGNIYAYQVCVCVCYMPYISWLVLHLTVLFLTLLL